MKNNSRRQFMKTLALAGIGSQIFLLSNCSSSESWPVISSEHLTPKQAYLVLKIQEVLFPDDGNGPSNKEIQSFQYLLWKLQSENSNNNYISLFKKGLSKVEKQIDSYINNDIRDLTIEDWETIVQLLTKEKLTRNWLSNMLTTILEALTLDPIYNINQDEVGWKWLEHQKGQPQPSSSNKFPSFYNG